MHSKDSQEKYLAASSKRSTRLKAGDVGREGGRERKREEGERVEEGGG